MYPRISAYRFSRIAILFMMSGIVPVTKAGAQPIAIQVPVSDPWYDTGIDILTGQRLTVLARGSVKYGTGLAQNADANGVGAQRDGTELGGDSPVPLATLLGLIGKIGGTTNVGTGTLLPEGIPGHGAGFVGSAYGQVVSNTGRLFLGYNDKTGQFFNNSGVFFVTLWTNNPTGTTNAEAATAVEICWPSVTDQVYVVQYAPVVDTNRWTDLGVPVSGNGTTNCMFDSTRGGSERFYRVLKIP